MHEIAQYRRELPVSLERMFENALDWEHLPHLHSSSFADLTLIERSARHWRADLTLRPKGLGLRQTVELTLDREASVWVSEVVAGLSKGTRIHTRATALAPRRIAVHVRFLVPRARPRHRLLGPILVGSYRRLYDEDEAMMVERQAALDRAKAGQPAETAASGARRLGTAAELLAPGRSFEDGRGRYRVARVDGELQAFSAVCPHLLGPLDDAPVVDGRVRCPWHGYCFDLRTGQDPVHGLRLPKAPRLEAREDGVWICPS